VATILSAQCTDAQVNRVTPALFARYRTAAEFASADPAEMEALIRPTGFFRQKARAIMRMARGIDEKFGGVVPQTMDGLLALHGVGRKTANVVLGAAFGKPGMVVDTHVRRISRRWGLTAHDDPLKIEHDLMRLLPEDAWSDFSLRVIYFGREICSAQRPQCPACPLRRLCPSARFAGKPPWMAIRRVRPAAGSPGARRTARRRAARVRGRVKVWARTGPARGNAQLGRGGRRGGRPPGSVGG
jgi:endonuclease-3